MSDESADEEGIEALRSRAPGEEPADPYEDVDLSELPYWWRQAIEEFQEYDLRPYRPPRFTDGTLKHEVVEDIEGELGIEITFIGVNVTYGDPWTVEVDGEPIGDIGRHRSPDGYTVFEMGSEEFEEWVREAATG